jgi:hypothetical protein
MNFLSSLFGKKEQATVKASVPAPVPAPSVVVTAQPPVAQVTAPPMKTNERKQSMKVDMRKKVSNFQADFKEAFGVNVRVYKGAQFAPDVALKELIPDGFRGGDLEVAGNTQVKTIEDKFQELFGIKIQVETLDGKLANNDATLASLKK